MYVDTCACTLTYTYLGTCIHMNIDMYAKKKGEFFIGTNWL